MPDIIRRKQRTYRPHGRHLQLASLDEGDGEGAKAVKEGLADEEEAAMLDEGATELGFEVAHTIVLVRTTGAHHVVSDKTMVGRVADGGIVGHDGWVEVVIFSVQSAAVPGVAHTLAKHEYELSANDFALRIENKKIARKG